MLRFFQQIHIAQLGDCTWGNRNAPRCPRIEKILTFEHLLLAAAAIPSIYYLLSLYSTAALFPLDRA